MNKLHIAMIALVAAASLSGCMGKGVGKGKGKAPAPAPMVQEEVFVTKG